MARVKLNSLLADLRGKLGTVVFSSNAAGFYVTESHAPAQPHTAAQQAQRNRFSSLTSVWSTLTEIERAAWKTFSERADNERTDWYGDPYSPSNRAQFISINVMRELAGLAITATAPTVNRPAPLPSMEFMFSASNDPPASYVDNLAAFDASIAYVHVMLSAWTRPARLSPIGKGLFVAVYPVASFGPIDISAITDVLFPFSDIPGRWYAWLTPVSAECRTGTTVTLSNLFDVEAAS